MGKRVLSALLLLLLLGALCVWGYTQGTRYLTGRFRDSVQPYLKSYSGLSIGFEDVVVRPFPLFAEIRGLTVVDERGSAQLRLEKLRAYLDPMALVFSREVVINYLWGYGASLSGDVNAAADIVETWEGREALAGKDLPVVTMDKWGVKLHRFMLEETRLDLTSPSGGFAFVSEPIRVTGRAGPLRIELWGGTIIFRKGDQREIPFQVSGEFHLSSANTLEVSNLNLESKDSGMALEGRISKRGVFLELTSVFSVAQILDYLGLEGPGRGTILADGQVSVQGPVPGGISVDLSISGDGHVEHLFRSLGLEPVVAGYVEGKGSLRGTYGDFRADGRVELQDGVVVGLGDAWLNTDFAFLDNRLAFTNGKGRIIGGEVSNVRVDVQLDASPAYDVSCNVREVDSVRLFEFIGWVPPHGPGRISGDVRVSGTGGSADDLSVEGQAFFLSNRPANRSFERVTAASTGFFLDKGILALQPITLYTASSRASAVARADLRKKTLAVDFGGRGENIGEFAEYFGASLTGPYIVNGRVDGPFSEPLVNGEISLGPGNFREGKYDSVALDFTLMGSQLTIPRFLARLGTGILEGDGTLEGWKDSQGMDYRFMMHARSIPAQNLAPFLEWPTDLFRETRVNGNMELEGKNGTVTAGASGSFTAGTIRNQRFDLGHFDFRVDERGIEIHSLDIERNLSILKTSGTLGFNGEYCLEFSDSEFYLSDLDFLPPGFEGLLKLEADCALTRRAGRRGIEGKGILSLENLSVRQARFGGGVLHFSLLDRILSIEGELMNRKGHVRGWVSMDPETAWSLNVKLDRGDYAPIVTSLFETTESELVMDASAELDIHRLDGSTEGRLEIDGLSVEVFGTRFESTGSVEALLHGNELSIVPFSLRGGENYFDFGGTLRFQETLDINLGGRLNLSVLRGVSRSFQAADGDGWLVLEVSGPWDSPSIDGGLHFQDGSIVLKGVPGRFRNIEGTLFLEKNRFGTDGLTASWGGGQMNLVGAGALTGSALGDFHFELMLNDITLRPAKDLLLIFGGELYFDGYEGRRYLTGDLSYDKAIYRGRVDYKSWLVNLRRKQSVPPESTWAGQTEMNIHVTGKDTLVIENNIARAFLNADVYLMGTLSRPRLLGRMEAEQGKVFFRSHEFRIVSGSADFINPNTINPVFNIEAETFTQGYAVRLRLEGPMDQFNMSLDSDPPLTETDILALLTVGRIEEDIRGMEGEIGAAEAASFLSGDIQDAIETRLTAITGFDRFQLDPHVNSSVGTMGPRLTVGKRLLSDRLFVTYSSDIGTTEGQTVSLEYHLTRGVSVLGQRDESGANGVDLRIHIDFD